MKRGMFVLLFCAFFIKALSQRKDFEGIITYKIEVKSKSGQISDKMMGIFLALGGDKKTTYIKSGNYRQSSGFTEVYYINKDQKVYYKFKNVDTLYYLDYASDTSKVIGISRPKEQQKIMGFQCNSIVLKSNSGTTKYFFSPQLRQNPAYDKDNTIGNFNVYAKETGSVWLSCYDEANLYSTLHTATKVDDKPIGENIFELPALPQKKFISSEMIREPEFGGNTTWKKYLETKTNNALGSEYIEIPKGESGAIQVVKVSFWVSEKGEVQQVSILNANEIHPKLAEEAIRVVKTSGIWKPATIYGEKIDFVLNQPITFQVYK